MQDFNAAELFSLKGKRAVLTGAAGFFGTYFSRALLDAGADEVILIDRNSAETSGQKQALAAFDPSRVKFLTLDQYDREASAQAFGCIAREGAVDVLVNNSFDFSQKTGFNAPDGRIASATYEQIMSTFDSAVYWPFQATQIIANGMVAEGRELSVINIGSMYSLIAPNPALYEGRDYFNPPGYSMAKSAVVAFTRYAASFYGPSVRANALLPGAIPNTEKKSNNSEQNRDEVFWNRLVERTLLKRVGHPKDLVGALLYLASPASSYMTGQTIVVDGGWVVT